MSIPKTISGVALTLPLIAGSSSSLATGTLSFELESEIGKGEGRSSTVHIGRDPQLGAILVYKRIPISKMPDRATYFDEARRLHEARHPHVVPIKYACQDADHIYFAMPHYVGGSLNALLAKRALTVREIVKYGLGFLMGLHHAHVRGMIHFDVKPTNILLDASGAAALADFGLSRKVDGLGLADQPSHYEPHAAPERDASSTLSKASDVYQAGLTIYRMCVGHLPWEEQIATMGGVGSSKFGDAVVKGSFPNRAGLPLHIPKSLKKLIKRALEVAPDARTSSVLDLLVQLAAVDSRLDWQWTDLAGKGQEWVSRSDRSPRRISLVPKSGKWSVDVHRVKGKQARLHTQCLEGVSESAARLHVEALLGQDDDS